MCKNLQAANNQFLMDHVIGGNQVLPTVCAIAWMVDATESVYNNFYYSGLENYKLFKGIVFDGSQASDYYIDLRLMAETVSEKNAEQIVVDVKISSLNSRGKPVYHYAAELTLWSRTTVSTEKAIKRLDVESTLTDPSLVGLPLGGSSSDRQQGDSDAAKVLYQDGTLFHGESFQGILDVIRCDNQGLLLACRVPTIASDKQGEFCCENNNIFANDLVYQAMLVWVRKQLGFGSLPSTTKTWDVYREVRVGECFYLTLDIVEQRGDKLIANITILGENGVVFAEIGSAEVTISESLNNLFLPVKRDLCEQGIE